MFSDFRKAFKPTKEELESIDKWINEHQLLSKNDIKLTKINNILYVSEPLQSFNEDCELCENFIDNFHHFVIGGKCNLHNCSCGYGFTCNDFKVKEGG